MIDEFVEAWNANNKALLNYFEEKPPEEYEDIVKNLFKIVINPYLKENSGDDVFDLKKIKIIDDGDYQGTQIYIIPFDTYQPCIYDYVYTYNYYGSCSGCDTLQHIVYDIDDKKEAAKEYHTLALHILQRCKFLEETEDEYSN